MSVAHWVKKHPALSAAAVLLVCLLTLLLWPLYLVREDMDDVEILWNDDEAFIKVGISKSWVSGSMPEVALREATALVSYQPTGTSDGVALYHIRNKKLEGYRFRDLKAAGRPQPSPAQSPILPANHQEVLGLRSNPGNSTDS